jgi:hypothetical protein
MHAAAAFVGGLGIVIVLLSVGYVKARKLRAASERARQATIDRLHKLLAQVKDKKYGDKIRSSVETAIRSNNLVYLQQTTTDLIRYLQKQEGVDPRSLKP